MKTQTFDAAAFLARFDAMDRALVSVGFPATSPWWRSEIERFVRALGDSRRLRRWVLRVGRRGGKSSTLCRLAVAWALWGAWVIPPGDTAIVPFVSTDRTEASGRIRTIRDILRALGVACEERGEEIELRDRRVVFKVVTCSTRGVVGFTSIMIAADEMAIWENRDTAANPAAEVMAALRPTMATQPFGFEIDSSSPWSTSDYHHELFEAGDTEHQLTSFAPTWVANPTISEADTVQLEPDQATRDRAYGAIPGDAGISNPLFDAAAVGLNTRSAPVELGYDPAWRYVAGCDPSEGSSSGNAFSLVVVGLQGAGDSARFRVASCHEFRGVTPDEAWCSVAKVLRAYRLGLAHSDSWSFAASSDLARRYGLTLQRHNQTVASKTGSFSDLASLVAQNRIELAPFKTLTADLLSIRRRLSPTGGWTIHLPTVGGRHADMASALCLAVRASGYRGAQWVPGTSLGIFPQKRFADRFERAAYYGHRDRDEPQQYRVWSSAEALELHQKKIAYQERRLKEAEAAADRCRLPPGPARRDFVDSYVIPGEFAP